MITRFAPSPTGPLHLGHAYSALLAHDMARAQGGAFHLRIEDIDQTRARAQWEAQILDDLQWLGIRWDGAVIRQSSNVPIYQQALQNLWDRGLLFTCTCNRKDIMAAMSAPQEGGALAYGPDGLIYPGTCRGNDCKAGQMPMPRDTALRLDMDKALQSLGTPAYLEFDEAGRGAIRTSPAQMLTEVGDIILSRKDFPGSYHLSVVLDDAALNVSDVVRGHDLFDATKIHVALQMLLGLATPRYHHHPLIRDDQGKRLAKRDDARAIAKYRAAGATPEDIRVMVGLLPA